MELNGQQLKYGFLNNYAVLVHRLSTSSILPHVYSGGIITANEKERISACSGESSKTDLLLEIIHRLGVGNPDVFVKFFKLLSDDSITAGQQLNNVLKKIKEDSTSEDVQMKFQYASKKLEETDRLLIDKNKSTLIQALSPPNILPQLISYGAVSCPSKEKIMAERTQDDQVQCLLHVICEGGSPSVDIFITVLEETDMYDAIGKRLRQEKEDIAMKFNNQHGKKRTVIDHSVLLEDLKDIYHAWEEFGLQLGISFPTLKEIREIVTGKDGLVDYCLNRIIDAWLRGNPDNVNRDYLVSAIEKVGGYPKVATEIKMQDFPIKMKSLSKIVKSIRPLKHEYSILGVHLGVSLTVIKTFERQQGDSARCMSEVLSHWFRMEGEDAPDKETLWEALVEIGNLGLAQKLKEEYEGIDFVK